MSENVQQIQNRAMDLIHGQLTIVISDEDILVEKHVVTDLPTEVCFVTSTLMYI